jgi:predicted  nucleic acid-binding Zn-ribbon protein
MADFESLVKRFNALQSELGRAQGRKEEAERQLATLREACLAKNIDPETLGDRISGLESDLAREMSTLESDLISVEKEAAELLRLARGA